jgi:hypothetical protein
MSPQLTTGMSATQRSMPSAQKLELVHSADEQSRPSETCCARQPVIEKAQDGQVGAPDAVQHSRMRAHQAVTTRLQEAAPFSGVQHMSMSLQAMPAPHSQVPPHPSLPAPQRVPSHVGQQPPGHASLRHAPASQI